jgi:hypothetical protein
MFFYFVKKQNKKLKKRNSPYFFIIHLNDLKIELCLIVPIQRKEKKFCYLYEQIIIFVINAYKNFIQKKIRLIPC